MNKKDNNRETAQFSGIPVSINYKDSDESIKIWIQNLLSCKNLCEKIIFAKARMEDNSILFYTKEGLMFHENKFEQRLPNEMFSDELMVGVICPNFPIENPEVINFTAKLVANPKASDKISAELVKFRREMIQKFGQRRGCL